MRVHLRSRAPSGAESQPAVHAQNPSSETKGAEAPPRGAAERSRLPRRSQAVLIGALIIAVGLLGSAFAAAQWRSTVAQSSKTSFESTATGLINAVDSKLNANLALTRTMQAIATMEPGAGDTRFLKWYQKLQRGAGPSPNDVVAAFIQSVPASDLATFERQTQADPAYRALIGGKFQIFPSGHRSVYCLARALVGNAGGSSAYSALEGVLDYCSPVIPFLGTSPYAALTRMATDTGAYIVFPVKGVPNLAITAIGVAVYRDGAPVATVSERRAALVGYIATSFDSTPLIQSVLVGLGSLTMAVYHANVGGPLQLIGRAGANPQGRSPGFSLRRSLAGGWVIDVTGTARTESANAEGLVVLGLGLLITALAFQLYRVLVRSRGRAWGLVGEKTDELEYRALHDPLTGLPNRSLVIDRAEQILARARRFDSPVTVLFLDVDGFKQINDGFGHQAGDDVLREVGERLQAVLREGDTVGRLGGDEFVMVLDCEGTETADAEQGVAERILAVLREPFELPNTTHSPISVSASIGVATGRPSSAEDLLQDADLAMYEAKAAGKGGYVLFESAMQVVAQDRMRLEMDLADALDANQLFLAYQPIVDLKDEQVVAVEALLRWQHPTRGLIQPDLFIPIAESTGLIISIGRWVLQQACIQCAAWNDRGHPLSISVNVSTRQFERREFVEEVRAALAESGLEPTKLTLEITETVLMRRPVVTAQLITDLKAVGVSIAIDDFGTGYSSLGYLRQFSIDSLKIDRSFITGLALSSEANALTHTLIQLGKTLGMQTVAEGVEQNDQLEQLQREGCDLVQGFLFARPLTPEAVEQYLEHGPGEAGAVADRQLHPVSRR